MKTLILLLLFISCSASELRVGLFLHDVDNLWCRNSKESGTDLCIEYVSDPSFLDLKYVTGIFLNNHNTTNAVYTYAKRDFDISNFYFSIGVGLTLHDGITQTTNQIQQILVFNNKVILINHVTNNNEKQLGSRILLRLPIEIGYRYKNYSVAVCFTHMSNAYTYNPNEGMDFVGVKVGCSF